MLRTDIETFITGFKSVFPEEIEFVFYRGYCYWFAFILANRFKGEIWFNPSIVHFAAQVDGQLYDIYGKVEPGRDPVTGEYNSKNDNWVTWDWFQRNNHEAVESIVKTCIKKEV